MGGSISADGTITFFDAATPEYSKEDLVKLLQDILRIRASICRIWSGR